MAFPETPLLIYPSLAKRYGVEASLLYVLCQQLKAEAESYQTLAAEPGRNLSLDNASQDNVSAIPLSRWLAVTDFWSSQKLNELTLYLKNQQLFAIDIGSDQVLISDLTAASLAQDNPSDQLASPSLEIVNTRETNSFHKEARSDSVRPSTPSVADESVQVLPVYDVPPAPAIRPLPRMQDQSSAQSPGKNPVQNSGQNPGQSSIQSSGQSATISDNSLRNRGPAPSFGGSTGWKKRSNDAFQNLLERQEQLSKQLQSMTMDWKPSQMFYSTLVRNNIPQSFADNCLDEFILFYCDKNKKERSWDQKFLAWVKRAWVQRQTQDNKELNSNKTSQQTGFSHENSQRDTREKRKRITAAIMDINDTNW